MTSLLFVAKPSVYLPEIPAYRKYLAKHHAGVAISQSTAAEAQPQDYDIVWRFMGTDTHGEGQYVVHEYNSLSTQPFAKPKNVVKRLINKRPDRRVFLSEKVRQGFGFRDNVPSGLRDMGIDESFFAVKRSKTPDYDFVYAGGLNRGPVIAKVLDRFMGPLRDAKVLLIGEAPAALSERYKANPNIVFHGRVPYLDIPALMARGRYGFNIMPDIYPFNVQTATKVLEYCAVGLPVVTTDYSWIGDFEKSHDAKFFRISGNFSNLTMDNLARFDFRVPDVKSFMWERVIAESGIFSFLEKA